MTKGKLLADFSAIAPATPGSVAAVFNKTGEKEFMVYEGYYVNHPKAVAYLQLKQEDEGFRSMLSFRF